MSLINDALKRTQQTSASNEPPRLDDLELHPVEPVPPPPSGGRAKWVIWLAVSLVIVCNLVVWMRFKDRGTITEVVARTADVQEAEVVASEPEPSAVANEPPALNVQPLQAGDSNSTSMVEVPVEERATAREPDFELKTIVVHPVRPSAMINHRILFVGDTVHGYTVTAIGEQTVTLRLGEDELVLSLP